MQRRKRRNKRRVKKPAKPYFDSNVADALLKVNLSSKPKTRHFSGRYRSLPPMIQRLTRFQLPKYHQYQEANPLPEEKRVKATDYDQLAEQLSRVKISTN